MKDNYLIEIVWHVPSYFTVLPPFLYDSVEEGQHVTKMSNESAPIEK
jgi:hypothetical protein